MTLFCFTAFLVQHNFGEMAEGALRRMSPDGVALFYQVRKRVAL